MKCYYITSIDKLKFDNLLNLAKPKFKTVSLSTSTAAFKKIEPFLERKIGLVTWKWKETETGLICLKNGKKISEFQFCFGRNMSSVHQLKKELFLLLDSDFDYARFAKIREDGNHADLDFEDLGKVQLDFMKRGAFGQNERFKKLVFFGKRGKGFVLIFQSIFGVYKIELNFKFEYVRMDFLEAFDQHQQRVRVELNKKRFDLRNDFFYLKNLDAILRIENDSESIKECEKNNLVYYPKKTVLTIFGTNLEPIKFIIKEKDCLSEPQLSFNFDAERMFLLSSNWLYSFIDNKLTKIGKFYKDQSQLIFEVIPETTQSCHNFRDSEFHTNQLFFTNNKFFMVNQTELFMPTIPQPLKSSNLPDSVVFCKCDNCENSENFVSKFENQTNLPEISMTEIIDDWLSEHFQVEKNEYKTVSHPNLKFP
jgi:hypothetical protein